MNEHEKEHQKCYELNGILHLPHYQHEGIFVSPSNKVGLIESDLIKQGATEVIKYLWTRHYNEDAK